MPAPRKSGAFLVLFWHAKEYNHSAVQLLHDTLHFLTRVPLFQQLVPDRTVAPPLAAQARRAVRHQRPAGNTALPGRQPAAGKTALRLGAGIRTSLPGTLGRFRLLERPLDLASEKLDIAKGEWALKQSKAAQSAQQAAANAGAKSAGSSGGSGSGSVLSSGGGTIVPYSAARLYRQGRSDTAIRSELLKEGYSNDEVANILKQLGS